MDKNNYKLVRPSSKDPIIGITKDEYDKYLNEYLTSEDNTITMINPNLIALFMSIIGPNKSYMEEIKNEKVKSLGARK